MDKIRVSEHPWIPRGHWQNTLAVFEISGGLAVQEIQHRKETTVIVVLGPQSLDLGRKICSREGRSFTAIISRKWERRLTFKSFGLRCFDKFLRLWQKEEEVSKLWSPIVDLHHRSFGRRQTIGFPKWFDNSMFGEMCLWLRGVEFSSKSWSTRVMWHDDVTWSDVDLIESSEARQSRVLKCAYENFSEVLEPQSPESSGNNCLKVQRSRVLKGVVEETSEARRPKVTKHRSDVVCWCHLGWLGPT